MYGAFIEGGLCMRNLDLLMGEVDVFFLENADLAVVNVVEDVRGKTFLVREFDGKWVFSNVWLR